MPFDPATGISNFISKNKTFIAWAIVLVAPFILAGTAKVVSFGYSVWMQDHAQIAVVSAKVEKLVTQMQDIHDYIIPPRMATYDRR